MFVMGSHSGIETSLRVRLNFASFIVILDGSWGMRNGATSFCCDTGSPASPQGNRVYRLTPVCFPHAEGANTVTAIAEDLVGNTGTATITLSGSATPVDPVQLSADPVGGFAPLSASRMKSVAIIGGGV